MLRRRTRKPICYEILENLREQKHAEKDSPSRPNDELDEGQFTTIWENPERLSDKEDFSLLYQLLSRQLSLGHFEDPLTQKQVGTMFTLLLMQFLKEERRKQIDHHVILAWLDAGDRLFSEETEPNALSKRNYAVLKLYYLCRTWKAQIECFSCGCIQKQVVELYLENDCSRLNDALLCIVKAKKNNKEETERCIEDLNPAVLRLVKNASNFSSIDMFSYYVEVLQELHGCSLIDVADEKASARLIQLAGLLCELSLNDVPEACSKLHRLLTHMGRNQEKKNVTAVDTVLRSKLLPKIFEYLTKNSLVKMHRFNRISVQEYVDIVAKKNYSFAEQSIFAPLQLLNLLYSKWDAWKRTRSVVKSRIDSLDLSSSHGPVIVLYMLSFIYRTDPSLLADLTGCLEEKYKKADSNQKGIILLIIEIAEKLALTNESMASFLNENAVKTRLLRDTDPIHSELVFSYLPDLKPLELNQFLKSKEESLSDEAWSDLFRVIKDTEVTVQADGVWKCAVEKKNSDRNAICFITKQLNAMAERQDGKMLTMRVSQVFNHLKTTFSSPKLVPRELLLFFPKVLFSLTDTQYLLLPPNTSNFLIPLLILSYCLFFDGNELEIAKMFRILKSKIRKENFKESNDDPIDVLDEICETIRSGKVPNCDISFVRSCAGSDFFLKTLFETTVEGHSQSADVVVRMRERTVDVCSILFGRLAPQLQSIGDKEGKTPYCQIAVIINKFVTGNLPSSSNPKVWKITERAIEGFSCMTLKWNSIFVVAKVMDILSSAKNHADLLARMIGVIRRNQDLLNKLRKRKEFLELESALR
ncbi:unnamed protein product [Caenorhabditis sp. 36 PRJEB53466]|nr:unnamed protein product [Caenorhabditis sp. 36 PRJEB53466]